MCRKKTIKTKNTLEARRPLILPFIDPDKNANINPNKLPADSSRLIWWKCPYEHSFKDRVKVIKKVKTLIDRCPYCSGKVLLVGYNDLQTKSPKIAKEWNYDRNKVKPNQISYKSRENVWWRCKNNHEWQRKVITRVETQENCPICSKKEVVVGKNDFTTIHPEIAKMWNYKKNLKRPEEYLSNSVERVWWFCTGKHHMYKQAINERVKKEICPHCVNEATPYPEKIVYYYVKKYFPDAINNYILDEKEFDIYIPSIDLVIEYDGKYYHRNLKKDINKNAITEKEDIKLIRIREPGCPLMPSKIEKIVLKDKSFTTLSNAIKKLLNILEIDNAIVDIIDDLDKIKELK